MVMDSSNISIISASSQTATISTTDMGSVGMQLSGTWTGTLLPQVTVDGVNWITITIAPVPAATVVSSITANGIFQANVSGFKSFRLSSQIAPPWTGTATISLQATPTTATISELLAGGTSGSTTVVQPTASLLNATVVGPAASGAAASGNPVQIAGVYNSTAPSPSTGQLEPLQLDSLGDLQINSYTAIAGEDLSNNVLVTVQKPLATSSYSPLVFTDFGSDVTKNIKASAGNVFSIYCTNANSAIRFVGIWNSATTASGAPVVSFAVPGNGAVLIDDTFLTSSGISCGTGIAFGFSTSASTYSAGAAADCTITVLYV